jgi:hypothetical protein
MRPQPDTTDGGAWWRMGHPYRGRRLDHYDPGDKRPHLARSVSVGGRFMARERGAFRVLPMGERDLACVRLAVAVNKEPSWTEGQLRALQRRKV